MDKHNKFSRDSCSTPENKKISITDQSKKANQDESAPEILLVQGLRKNA